jgi:hypothetical protein
MKDSREIKVYIAAIRRTVFINAWLRNGFNKKAAAIEAGFPESNASKMGSLLFNTQEVQDILAKTRKHLQEKGSVTAETVAVELEEAAQLAKDCRNPNALVSAIGKKMQLYGLEAAKKVQVEDITPKVQKETLDQMLQQMDDKENDATVH